MIPRAVHTTASVPIHWQDQMLSDLKRDALGVIDRIPYGEQVSWCHRMVVTRKHNGTPRRTVDLSPLNKHCKRRHYQPNRHFTWRELRVPKCTWKTVSGAWNGYHSVPSVNLTVTAQPSSLRSDDGDTRGRLNASFSRVTATTPASMRYYLTLSERNVVWVTPSTMTPTYRKPLTFSSV